MSSSSSPPAATHSPAGLPRRRPGRRLVAQGLAALMVCPLLPVPATQAESPRRPADLLGTLRFGMTVAELAAARPDASSLSPGIDYGPLRAPLVLRDHAVSGLGFRVYLQVDQASGRLRQLLFERRAAQAAPKDAARIRTWLEASLGRPAVACTTGTADSARAAALLSWELDQETVHLIFFDQAARGIAYFDPNTGSDPLEPARDRERIKARGMPRRLLIRVHGRADSALDPRPSCTGRPPG